MLRRVLIAYTSRPPIIEYLTAALARRGVAAKGLYADENTWFDRWVIHWVNKLAHNFRIVPKSRNLFEDHPAAHINYRSARLRSAIAAWDPDLVFVIRGLGYRPWAVERARTRFGWWVEADERIDEALREVPQFDRFFFINSSSVEAARRAGYDNCAYLSHAADPVVFRPLPGVPRSLDFAFVGLWSPKRQQYLEAALDVSDNGAVYGPKWRRKTYRDARFRRIVRGGYIGGEPLVRLYNSAKIVINITEWGAASGIRRSGMTMRLFEVPACGTLLLTDRSAEIDAAMTPGEHVATFADVEEFRAKFAHYLEHEVERGRIAARGMARVRAEHTYDRIADTLIGAYQELG